MCKKFLSIIAAVIILIEPCGALSAQSYALIEARTGRVLSGGNLGQRLPMASTTKIMTGLLACESGKFDNEYTVSQEAIQVEGSSMGLLPGEKITLRDLTYGLMLESGNDAANAIAYILAGSVPAFAEKMNKRAAELGLLNTHFANPSGLDANGHYTTALDLARLGAFAMKNSDFEKIVSTYKAYITYNGSKNGRTLYNHNIMLKLYDGAIGIKTGYIKRSGRCLVTCARRSGVTLVAVTLNAHDDLNDHKALLDYGFGVLKSRPLFTSYPDITASITGGNISAIKCEYDRDITAGLKDDEIPRVKMQINMPSSFRAPVKKGQKLGEIVFTLDGAVLNGTDILAAAEAAVKQKKPGLFDGIKNFLSGRFFKGKAQTA